MKTFLKGWAIIFALLLGILKQLFEFLRELMRLLGVGRRDRNPQDACCADNPHTRARPDPYIYSQQWLQLRHLAYTWDNPDFTLVDPATLSAVDNHSLKAGYTYHVRATIHNGSLMAAINTAVNLQVLRFGVGTPVIQHLGTVHLDVPPFGSNEATFDWTTPPTAGHNCLQAIISHPDDANPLNNIGQHNTDVAVPASPTRKLHFSLGNPTTVGKRYILRMDSYHLPDTPLRPNTSRATGDDGRGQRRSNRRTPTRDSLAYLHLLQEINDPAKFPVPAYLQAHLSHQSVELGPGEEVNAYVEMNPPPAGQGRQRVNVHVLDGEQLIGGVTAYVDEE